MGNILARTSLAVRFVLIGATGAAADVTIEQTFRVDAMGSMSVLVSEGTMTTAVAGRRARTDNRVQAASDAMLRLARNPNGAAIVLLEKERLVTLMPEHRQYSEISFEDLRAQLDHGTRAAEDALHSEDILNLPVAEADCHWFMPEATTAHTRERASIAGVEAERHVFAVRQTCLVEDTGQECDLKWRLERWQANALPGGNEARAFESDLGLALGGEDIISVASQNAGGLLALFRRGWNQVFASAAQLPGYPVKTEMSLEIGGEFCTSGDGMPIARQDDWDVGKEIAKDTARTSAINQASNTVATTVARTVGGIGGMIAGSAAEVGTRKVLEGVGDEEDEDSPLAEEVGPAPDPYGDSVLLFRLSAELTEISRAQIPDAYFEVPAGWEEVSP